MCTGADLTLPRNVSLKEGNTQEVCILVSENEQTRERDIHITFSVTPTSDTASKRILTIG